MESSVYTPFVPVRGDWAPWRDRFCIPWVVLASGAPLPAGCPAGDLAAVAVALVFPEALD